MIAVLYPKGYDLKMFEKIITEITIKLSINKLKECFDKRGLKNKQNAARHRIGNIRRDVLVGIDIPKYVPEFYLECKKILPSHDDELQYLKSLKHALNKKPAAKKKPVAKRKPAAKKKPAAKRNPAAKKK